VRWISYSLAPLSIFSAYDPRVPPLNCAWLDSVVARE